MFVLLIFFFCLLHRLLFFDLHINDHVFFPNYKFDGLIGILTWRPSFALWKKRAIYQLGIISVAHAPVHVTHFSVVIVHVDELSSARIWQHKLCATFSANVNINYRLPIKVYYRICTLRTIRIEVIHWNPNVFWALTWVSRY